MKPTLDPISYRVHKRNLIKNRYKGLRCKIGLGGSLLVIVALEKAACFPRCRSLKTLVCHGAPQIFIRLDPKSVRARAMAAGERGGGPVAETLWLG